MGEHMKKTIIILMFIIALADIAIADDNQSTLTRINDEFYTHIFGITNFSVNSPQDSTVLSLPDLHNGKKYVETLKDANYWKITGYSECDINTGTKSASYSCFQRLANGRAKLVSAEMCLDQNKPYESVFCNTGNNQYVWSKKYIGECSSTCGTGEKSYDYQCVLVSNDGSRELKEDTECELFLDLAIAGTDACTDYSSCGFVWESSEWSQCSDICTGTRTQSRTNRCVDEKTKEVVNSSLCTDAESVTTQDCTNECLHRTTCLEILTDNPEAIDGYYDLDVNGAVMNKYCDMTNGGYTYMGRFTFAAKTYGTLTPWFSFKSARIKYVSGKIACSGTNHCSPSASAVATYNPSRAQTAISYAGSTYIHNRDQFQTIIRYGDTERLSGSSTYDDNYGSVKADIYLR